MLTAPTLMPTQFQLSSPGVGGELLALIAVALGILVTLFWMVVAWRAMRAHEKLVESVDRLSRATANANCPS